jgi:hypothetical protein
MKISRVATFAEEGKWTPGAGSTLIIGDWQAWVDGEGHWKVRGPDPDNEAHYADGDIELTEAEYIEAGNSEARRKIRAQRAKKAARAYIQSMSQPSRARHHATKKKSPAQLQCEIDDALRRRVSHSTMKPTGYQVAYLVPNPRRGEPGQETMLQLWYAGKDVVQTMAEAMADLRAAKRRGYTAWIVDTAGRHVPVKGAARPYPGPYSSGY